MAAHSYAKRVPACNWFVRSGFFERPDFEAVRANLPEAIRLIMVFAYTTGWRVQSEILPLLWKQVNWTAGTVRLEPNTTKNDDGRTFPFEVLPELADMLRQQWEHTKALQRATGRLIPFVFHRNGQPIKSFKTGWKSGLCGGVCPRSHSA